MESGLRFAAIDIGSNAIRLLFSRVIENDNKSPYIVKESLIRMPLRLGYDVFNNGCLLYTSPSPRDRTRSRMPSSA